MSLPHDADRDPDDDNEELVRYLLGLLPDEVTERIDEASIADDEVAARLRIVETDLIDSYVRGQLTGARLERFESYYLLSPRRRESVRLAAGFVRVVDRSVARTQRVTWKDRIPGPTSLARMVAAAALVTIVCGLIQFQADANPARVDARDLGERGGRSPAATHRRTNCRRGDRAGAGPRPLVSGCVGLAPVRSGFRIARR